MKLPLLHRASMIGCLVFEFDVRGCMAENHVLKNVWKIVEFGCQTKYIPGSAKIYMARCRVIQSRDDLPEEWCNIPTDDIWPFPKSSALGRPINYAWRH